MGLIIDLHVHILVNHHFSAWLLSWAFINFGWSFLQFLSIVIMLLFWNWLSLNTCQSRLSWLIRLCRWLFKNFFSWIFFNGHFFSNFFFNIFGFNGFNLCSFGRRGKLDNNIGVVGLVQHFQQILGLFDFGYWCSHNLKGYGLNTGILGPNHVSISL